MCGRFSQSQPAETIARVFQLSVVPLLLPRYNIAPTQSVATISQTLNQERHCQLLRWGLIPPWAKDAKIGSRLINARSETVAEKPAFRSAFKQRRCLIMADGFYEWQLLADRKQPFYFRLQNQQPFAFAGLWERWQGDAAPIESCTILTTEANEVLKPVHDRMPVILEPQDYDAWLDPNQQDFIALQALLQPYPSEAMVAYPVSTQVNNPTNDIAACIEPQAK